MTMDSSVDPAPFVVTISRSRRALDIVLGSLALVLASWLLLLAALAVLLVQGRPVFYRATRVGEDGRPFHLFKLRTMRTPTGSDRGPGVTASGDPRVTGLGRVLRRLSIDELPQLWSVVRGQMTLVGPRPESVELAERYDARSRAVLRARPGLTGPAQLRYRDRSATPPAGWTVEEWYLRELVPLRVAADLDYLRRPTMRRTLYYLWVTALFVVGVVDLGEGEVRNQRPQGPEPATGHTGR